MKTSTPLHDAMVMSIDPEAIFEEIDAIADPMERYHALMRIAKNTEPERKATEVRLRAERRYRRLSGKSVLLP